MAWRLASSSVFLRPKRSCLSSLPLIRRVWLKVGPLFIRTPIASMRAPGASLGPRRGGSMDIIASRRGAGALFSPVGGRLGAGAADAAGGVAPSSPGMSTLRGGAAGALGCGPDFWPGLGLG
ncbi:MAG: hypothetical protein DPW14_08580 [Planctomycetes bacterium]|nr:hypothetical protein [Planctomycetota bacterium]